MPPNVSLDLLHAKVRPFEEAELALVRTVVHNPQWLAETDEHALRYALNLARVTIVHGPGGDVDLDRFLDPFRAEVLAVVGPLLLRPGGVDRRALVRLAPHLGHRARLWRDRVVRASEGRLGRAELDAEVCQKALVLVAGGGGAVSYVYLGGLALLEQYGLVPRYLAGTSMGAVLLAFRARRVRFEVEEILDVMKLMSFRKVFRFFHTESRYGLPATMRLYLRHAIGRFMQGADGHPLSLNELAIPLIVSVTGIRSGALPRDPSYYEHLLDLHGRKPRPHVVKRMVGEIFGALGELVTQRDRLARLHLGADPETAAFDTIDAVGFSSALPGVIHYDVLRDDERMHAMLRDLFARHDLFRLVDGGLVDNVPACAAWAQVMKGAIGTRNAFVLAFDAFGPKLSQPLWFGLEQLVSQNVTRNRPYVHHAKSFQQVLSPVDLFPNERHLRKAIQWGKQELLPDMPLIARMVRPFPALGGEA